ncbi:MAG: DUF5309 domain-containing protein [Duncaniella sp.]|nr:DUF5309 domain-containing protein [Duncaniella sp.]
MSETNTNHAILNGAPLTTDVTDTLSPSLLRSAVDDRIVRIRPSATPLDQISRMCGARRVGSMKVDYYSVDCKPGSVSLASAPSGSASEEGDTFTVTVRETGVVSPSETVMFPKITVSGSPLVCYVKAVEGKKVTLVLSERADISTLAADDLMVRMGRAAGELDVQTPQYAALPRKDYNYCQIFKAQIEESLYQRLADKEIGWSFTDQEEVAVVDMRLGMEKSFLFGNRNRLVVDDIEGKEVYLTGGIWRQAGKEWNHVGKISTSNLIEMMKKAFTGGGGSRRKVLIGGSDLIEALNTHELVRTVGALDKETVWGVDFDRIVSKFGTLYVIHSEVFDLCGRPGGGMVIDPEYITKYSHVPFQAERISFRRQGVRNTEAVVLTESSCLVLRYPESHMRINFVPAV